jgi:hypothetical protein
MVLAYSLLENKQLLTYYDIFQADYAIDGIGDDPLPADLFMNF